MIDSMLSLTVHHLSRKKCPKLAGSSFSNCEDYYSIILYRLLINELKKKNGTDESIMALRAATYNFHYESFLKYLYNVKHLKIVNKSEVSFSKK